MPEVKWIKLSTSMFEDEKIRLIESMPEADTLLIIWVKLLAQTGKTNASGYIFLNENIPYTDEMLATIFNRPVNVVRMALEVFQKFGMIDIDKDHFINVTNWAKYQSLTGLDKIREDTRNRVAAYRERKKLEEKPDGNGCNVTSNKNVTDKELELEEEIDKEIDIKTYIVEIITHLNAKCNKKYKTSSTKTRDLIKARLNLGFTVEDFKTVIDVKASHWLDDNEMNQYLRPSTLFGTKFEEYLNQNPKQKGAPTHASNKGNDLRYSQAGEFDYGF